METRRLYRIEVQGRVDGTAFNAGSPLHVTVLSGDAATTRLTVETDQSGLIGLLRYMHGRGILLLSIRSKSDIRSQMR